MIFSESISIRFPNIIEFLYAPIEHDFEAFKKEFCKFIKKNNVVITLKDNYTPFNKEILFNDEKQSFLVIALLLSRNLKVRLIDNKTDGIRIKFIKSKYKNENTKFIIKEIIERLEANKNCYEDVKLNELISVLKIEYLFSIDKNNKEELIKYYKENIDSIIIPTYPYFKSFKTLQDFIMSDLNIDEFVKKYIKENLNVKKNNDFEEKIFKLRSFLLNDYDINYIIKDKDIKNLLRFSDIVFINYFDELSVNNNYYDLLNYFKEDLSLLDFYDYDSLLFNLTNKYILKINLGDDKRNNEIIECLISDLLFYPSKSNSDFSDYNFSYLTFINCCSCEKIKEMKKLIFFLTFYFFCPINSEDEFYRYCKSNNLIVSDYEKEKVVLKTFLDELENCNDQMIYMFLEVLDIMKKGLQKFGTLNNKYTIFNTIDIEDELYNYKNLRKKLINTKL